MIKSILILKVAKNFRETFFGGVELIRVEVMKSRETWRHNDIQKEVQNGIGMVDMVDYNEVWTMCKCLFYRTNSFRGGEGGNF